MTGKTELESKFEVSPADFARLLQQGKVARRVHQENFYFDRDWRLAELSVTCRLRFTSDDLPTLEVKLPIATREGRREVHEYSHAITDAIASWLVGRRKIDVDSELPPDIASPLLRLGVKQLHCMGTLRNERHVLQLADGQLELDRVQLPFSEDFFEVEIEESDVKRHRQLVSWLLNLVPDARPSLLSKFQRLRAALEASRAPVEGNAGNDVRWDDSGCVAHSPSREIR